MLPRPEFGDGNAGVQVRCSSLLLSPPSPLEIVTERLCRHPAGLPQGKRILRLILSPALCAVQSGTLDCEG